MRSIVLILSVAALAGCAARSAPPMVATDPATPFEVPMDPGTIRCDQLSNPAALAAATGWVDGRARAAVLSGRRADVPDATALAADLARICAGTPAAAIRDAANQLGI